MADASLRGRVELDAFGRLAYLDRDGERHVPVIPVRAFPLAAPHEAIALVDGHGRELEWIDRIDALPAAVRGILEAELVRREFVPEIRKVIGVSVFATPSVWTVQTDRGDTVFTLRTEEDIRRLENGSLLVTSSHGLLFKLPDVSRLDRHSRRLVERFL